MSLMEARVTDYEARLRGGTARPADLAAIGEAIVASERASADRATQIAACASTFLDRTPECAQRLAAAAADDALPWRVRLMAAGARLETEGSGAASMFDRLAAAAPVAELTTAVGIIRSVPAGHAVPPLLRMLASPDALVQAAGCRALAEFDSPPAHAALQEVANNSAPGTPLWIAATVARARLGYPDARPVMGSAHAYFSGEDLIGAALALRAAGDSRAEDLLQLVTRKETGLLRLRAALLLSDSAPDLASRALDSILGVQDPQIRADALALYRERPLPLPAPVPRLLLESSPLVRLRAAELAIAWARRQPR